MKINKLCLVGSTVALLSVLLGLFSIGLGGGWNGPLLTDIAEAFWNQVSLFALPILLLSIASITLSFTKYRPALLFAGILLIINGLIVIYWSVNFDYANFISAYTDQRTLDFMLGLKQMQVFSIEGVLAGSGLLIAGAFSGNRRKQYAVAAGIIMLLLTVNITNAIVHNNISNQMQADVVRTLNEQQEKETEKLRNISIQKNVSFSPPAYTAGRELRDVSIDNPEPGVHLIYSRPGVYEADFSITYVLQRELTNDFLENIARWKDIVSEPISLRGFNAIYYSNPGGIQFVVWSLANMQLKLYCHRCGMSKDELIAVAQSVH